MSQDATLIRDALAHHYVAHGLPLDGGASIRGSTCVSARSRCVFRMRRDARTDRRAAAIVG